MFPPEPISAFTLPRRVWTVMSVVSARLRAARTMFSPSAKRCRGENHAAAVRIPADVMKRRRERKLESLANGYSVATRVFLFRNGLAAFAVCERKRNAPEDMAEEGTR